jgi:hypothetical protein
MGQDHCLVTNLANKQVFDWNDTTTYSTNIIRHMEHICLILHLFFDIRTFVSIVTESLRDTGGDYGRVPRKYNLVC